MVNLTSNGHSLPTQTYNSLKKQTFFGPGSPDVPACGSKFSSVASGAEPDHRGLKLDGAIGQGEICNSLKSEKFSKSFLSHIGKNKIKF